MRPRFKLNAQLAENDLVAQALKSEFPIFGNRPSLVYLDTAATSQKPSVVLEAEADFYKNSNANVHRAIHSIGEEATRLYEASRSIIARSIGAKNKELIFTRGATESINLVARTLGDTFFSKDEIILSEMEHHANLVPWQMLASRSGVVLRFVKVTDSGELDLSSLNSLLCPKTRLVSLTMASNVLGTINPIQKIISRAHAMRSLVLVDASQTAPRMRLDVKELDADFLVFSGHKMYGPTGIGVLYGKKNILESMPPFLGGGEMISDVTLEGYSLNELPYKFEAGTPPIAQAIGLAAAAQWLESIDVEALGKHETALANLFIEKIHNIPGVHVLGSAAERTGIVAFTMDGVHAHDLSAYLDRNGVAIRAGHHCAHPLARRFGIVSSVRASFGAYSLIADVEKTVELLARAREEL